MVSTTTNAREGAIDEAEKAEEAELEVVVELMWW